MSEPVINVSELTRRFGDDSVVAVRGARRGTRLMMFLRAPAAFLVAGVITVLVAAPLRPAVVFISRATDLPSIEQTLPPHVRRCPCRVASVR